VAEWEHGDVATTTTCPHGLDSGTCLICSTLGLAPGRGPVPAGRAEVITTRQRPPRRRRVGLLGGLVLVVGALVAVWLLIGLLWSLVRGAEIVLVGALCGYVGYRVGVLVGRHQAT
jgi:hypothetical protein